MQQSIPKYTRRANSHCQKTIFSICLQDKPFGKPFCSVIRGKRVFWDRNPFVNVYGVSCVKNKPGTTCENDVFSSIICGNLKKSLCSLYINFFLYGNRCGVLRRGGMENNRRARLCSRYIILDFSPNMNI